MMLNALCMYDFDYVLYMSMNVHIGVCMNV
jgi:hypothetical protein